MIDKNKVQQIVMNTLKIISDDGDTPFEIAENTKLIGADGVLDSMDLVNLTAELEEKLSDELDLDITIASEKAFSRKKSPFYNVEMLSQFIIELSEED